MDEESIFNKKFFRISYQESIRTTYQKYEIISFFDPISGIEYNTNQILELKLFDYTTGDFLSPIQDTRISLDEAIKLKYAQVNLIENFYEEIFETNKFLKLESKFEKENKSEVKLFSEKVFFYENAIDD